MYYKFLREGGVGVYSDVQWSLPTKNDDGTWTPGEWMPVVEKLELCESGYHVCTLEQSPMWAHSEMYEVEVRGESLDGNDKSCHQQARLLRRVETWNERTARLFACDCAEHVLSIFERERPDDNRVRNCIRVTRRYVNGDATDAELTAAGAAARTAAWAAAWDAAWDAAGAAARDAELKWQIERLQWYLGE